MILNILRIAITVAEVILIFNLLIIVHELGHFLAARWRGLQIDKFGVWFGKPLWKKTIKGVEFSLGCIPAGGFVLLPQMAPMEAVEGKATNVRENLPAIKPLDKIIVAFAGPLFSFLLAVLFALIVWAVGRPASEADTTTTIGYLVPNEPAAKAGFQVGDKILEVDGHPVSRFSGAINSVMWYVVRSERTEGETIPFKVQRGDQVITINSGFSKPQTDGWWERGSLKQVGVLPAVTPIVAKVDPGSLADQAGIQANDEILAADGQKLYHPQQLFELAQKDPSKPLILTVKRAGKIIELKASLGHPVVESVLKNSPAEVAGIQRGDRILAANNEPVSDPTVVVKEVQQHPDQVLSLTIQHGADTKTVRLLPAMPDSPPAGDGQNKPMAGFRLESELRSGLAFDGGGRMTVVHTPPGEQIANGIKTLTGTIGALLAPQSDIKLQHISGPVMIMRTYYLLFESDFGWQLALWFSVVCNINLAVINLLPIPVLDGGHILLAIVEGIRRRPINIRILEVLQGACALLLVGFMLYVTFYDVQDLPWNAKQRVRFNSPAKAAPPENR
jgi:regulator of sigma E protease